MKTNLRALSGAAFEQAAHFEDCSSGCLFNIEAGMVFRFRSLDDKGYLESVKPYALPQCFPLFANAGAISMFHCRLM